MGNVILAVHFTVKGIYDMECFCSLKPSGSKAFKRIKNGLYYSVTVLTYDNEQSSDKFITLTFK